MTLTVGQRYHLQLLMTSSFTTPSFLCPTLPLSTQTSFVFKLPLLPPVFLYFPLLLLSCPLSFHSALLTDFLFRLLSLFSTQIKTSDVIHSTSLSLTYLLCFTVAVQPAWQIPPGSSHARNTSRKTSPSPGWPCFVLFFSSVLLLCAHAWVWPHASASLPRTSTKRCLFCPYGLVYQAFSKSHGKSQTEKKGKNLQ